MNERPIPRALRPGWVLLALLVGVGLWWGVPRAKRAWLAGSGDVALAPGERVALPDSGDTLARPPAGARVKVQVLNASKVRGLARRATLYLRDRGWDVVEVGTTTPLRDESLVLDRSGRAEWARRAAHAMGGAAVERRPDSSRYLDLTILVGRTWRPPAEPFHP